MRDLASLWFEAAFLLHVIVIWLNRRISHSAHWMSGSDLVVEAMSSLPPLLYSICNMLYSGLGLHRFRRERSCSSVANRSGTYMSCSSCLIHVSFPRFHPPDILRLFSVLWLTHPLHLFPVPQLISAVFRPANLLVFLVTLSFIFSLSLCLLIVEFCHPVPA